MRLIRQSWVRNFLFVALRVSVCGAAVVFVLVPFYWLVVNSIKLPREYLAVPPTLVPSQVTFENYAKLFLDPNSQTLLALSNSIIITVATTFVTVVVGSLAAYSLTRAELPKKLVRAISYGILTARFYPKITTVIPYFAIVNMVGLLDTRTAIVVAYVALNLPTVIWLMMTFYEELPKEIEQSAMLDGCGPWQRFWKIAFPLSAPGLAAAGIFTALLSWIEFLIASSLAVTRAKTLPIAMSSFIVDKGMHWGPMSALGVVCVVPVLVLAGFAQRYLVRGLTLGAVKE